MQNQLIPKLCDNDELIYMKGSLDKSLTAFIDYTCAHTRRFRGVLQRSTKRFHDHDLTLAIRIAPTEQQLTKPAELAARAAIAANQQGKFPQMHDALFEEKPDYTEQSLYKLAEKLGLDLEQFKHDMMSAETDAKLALDHQSAEDSAIVPHTPMLFIDNILYEDVWDDTAILEAIEKPLGVRLQLASSQFFNWAASAGLALIIATVLALLLVNLGGQELYEKIRGSMVGFYFGDFFQLEMSLGIFINDGLMAIFFLVVGIEIKREFLDGELSEPSNAALPIFAALGGMLVPAAVYYFINAGESSSHGWGVPMATDIAFTLGILALLGDRVPTSLKVFVSALAIADDLGAILVIAIFYGHGFDINYFSSAMIVFALMVGVNLARIYTRPPYIILGIILWYFLYKSGLHATLAGVLTAIAIPSRPSAQITNATAQASAIIDSETSKRGGSIGSKSVLLLQDIVGRLRDPGFHLQHMLEKWNNYLILPLFAFFNTGILLIGAKFSFLQPEVLGTIMGLVIGKPLGILLFVFISIKIGVAKLSPEISWYQLLGAGFLAGVGFTMSIFIGSAAFSGEQLFAVKLSVLIASVIAALIGISILLFAAKKNADFNSSKKKSVE